MNEQVWQRIDQIRSEIEQGYYLEGDDGQPWPEKEWCRPCAKAVAHHYRRRLGMKGLSLYECWAGDDGPRACCGCGAVLYTGGGLTEYGVADEIEHFETYGPKMAAPGLIILLDSLDDDDPRRPQVLAWLEEAVASAEPTPPLRTMRDLLP